MESYKKWIVISIIAAAAGIVIVSLIYTTPSRKTEEAEPGKNTAYPPSSSPGPLMEQDLNKAVPVEELGVDINNASSLALLGDKYFESSKFNQAIEIYKKVLELNPNDIDTYNDLGLAYHYLGKSNLSVDTLRKGTEVMPTYQRVWLSLGFVLMSMGRNEEAKTALEKAAELNPETDVGREAKRMLGVLK